VTEQTRLAARRQIPLGPPRDSPMRVGRRCRSARSRRWQL